MKRTVYDLSGSVVLITGAAGGIGRAAALAVAKSGANLILGDVDDAQLRETHAAVERAGARAAMLPTDVREPDQCAALAGLAVEHFGRLDGALCIAGVINRETILTTSYETWKRVIDVNLTGTFLTVQAAARTMIACGSGGSIVTCSSGVVLRSPARGIDYVASKLGILAVTRSAAGELGPHGIRVNAIAPGVINTAMPEDGSLAWAAAQTPLHRYGEPGDLTGSLCFLLSDDSSYITGHTLHVNGGIFMG